MSATVGRVAMLLALFVAAGWWFSTPQQLDPLALDGLEGDAGRGEMVFWAAGCASCHSAPKAEGEARLVLTGGRAFASDFGTFYAPNISSDPDHGIGAWQPVDLANALVHGRSPEGEHYYPAFPYTAYRGMSLQDVSDLWAYLGTLPASEQPNRPHDVGFPFSIRRALAGWKLLFGNPNPKAVSPSNATEQRGQYLVEVLGHCGECHTPRNRLGGLQLEHWLTGAPHPSGKGKIPDITPANLTWSEPDLVEYFSSGFTPDFDVAGGEMAEVVENLAQLPRSDREAIAAYLKALPRPE